MRAPDPLTKSVILKSFLLIFLILPAGLLFACNSAAWSVQPESNFGFVFEFGSCSIDKLDTIKEEFIQDRVVEPSITIPLGLTDEQMKIIYGKMVEIDVAHYPEVFAIPKPLIGDVVMLSSPYNYALMVQNGESRISIHWTDSMVQPTTRKADQLRELFRLIIQLVQEDPGYQQLPEVNFGCI